MPAPFLEFDVKRLIFCLPALRAIYHNITKESPKVGEARHLLKQIHTIKRSVKRKCTVAKQRKLNRLEEELTNKLIWVGVAMKKNLSRTFLLPQKTVSSPKISECIQHSQLRPCH